MSVFLKIKLLFNSFSVSYAMRFLIVYLVKRISGLAFSESFSQTGEDLVLRSLVKRRNGIFYIDVGCHHPIKKSNTLWMYLKGGRGICIDANLNLTKEFRHIRKRDIVVHAAISDIEKECDFYVSECEAVSTINSNTFDSWEENWKLDRKERIRTQTLNSVLKTHIDHNKTIDVLSVDVEGHDLAVLKSIDLSVYRPMIIVLELHEFRLDQFNMISNETVSYLAGNNYQLLNYATMNAYFVDCKDTPK
jgi:FkbM family methyltransferase